MTATIRICDETTSGTRTHRFTLSLLSAQITVRDLIRKRVYEEVNDYNRSAPECFQGLVEPRDAERVLNGYKLRQWRPIVWEEQCQRALEAFEQNGFFIIVDDRQVTSLDDVIELAHDTIISFIKLVPLVGG